MKKLILLFVTLFLCSTGSMAEESFTGYCQDADLQIDQADLTVTQFTYSDIEETTNFAFISVMNWTDKAENAIFVPSKSGNAGFICKESPRNKGDPVSGL